jgi:hypothetical protein
MKLTVLCFAAASLALAASAPAVPADEKDEKEPAVAGADRAAGTSAERSAPPNTLTAEETAAGWKLLFDGETLDRWRGFNMKDLPAGWSVRDGVVRFDPPAEGAGERGDLITKRQYESFELALDWAVTPGGNSGIFFRVSEDAKRTYETGPEFQVLDNAGHKDGEKPVTSAGSNYALHAPVEDVTRPVGEWNEARIKVDGAHVEHWLNGTKLLEYDLWTDEWKQLVAASKFAQMPRYGLNRSGHIALQDHGNEVRFRNLKIRPL